MTGRSEGARVELGPEDRRQPAGWGFALVLGDALDAFRDAEPEVREGGEPEALHAYRVALRRARTILAAGRTVFPPEELALLRALTAELAAATTTVRDLDVCTDAFGDLADTLSPPLRPGAELLHDELVRRRDRERAALVAAISAEPHAVMLRRWHVMATVHRVGGSDPGPDALRPLGEVAASAIAHGYRRVARGAIRLVEADDPTGWHEARKGLKRLRYLLDAFGPLFPDEAVVPLSRELRTLQDRFGRLQDHVVHAELIREVGVSIGGSAALAAGAIVDHLNHRIERDLRRCRRRLARLDRPKVRAAVDLLVASASEA